MNGGKELINLDDPKNIVEFLRQPATKLAEFITGILISDTKDLKLAAGHPVQASIKCKLFSQLVLLRHIIDYAQINNLIKNKAI